MGKSYEFYIKTIKSIGSTYGIPKLTDRHNYIGFTYKSPITYLYLFTVFVIVLYERWYQNISPTYATSSSSLRKPQ